MHNSKKLLTRVLIFALLIALVTVPLFGFYLYDTCYYYQDQEVRDAMAGEVQVLVLGSSEGQRGIMTPMLDNYFSKSYNLSGSMMTLEGRFALLQAEAARNPVDTVILEVSYDTMIRDREEEGPEGDLYVLGRLNNPWQRIRFAASAFYTDELPYVFYDTMDRGWWCTRLNLGILDVERQGTNYADRGYMKTSANPMLRSEAEYRRIYHSQAWPGEITLDNMDTLQKLADYCQAQDIELVMVTLPVSKYMILKYTGLQELTDYYQDFAAANDCQYYDLNLLLDRDTLFVENEAYNDDVHLSDVGAYHATERLIQLIQLHRSGTDTAPMFYGSFEELDQAWLQSTN